MRIYAAFILASLLGCASASPSVSASKTSAKQVSNPQIVRPPLTEAQAAAEILTTQRLDRDSKLAAWRKWAADLTQPSLATHAIVQLAWADDSSVASLATRALEKDNQDLRLAAARALVHVGKADAARAQLLDMLAVAKEGDRATILWTLVAAGEKSISAAALDELRKGTITKVTRLDGGVAFDTSTLAALFSVDDLATLAKDSHANVRQFAALAFANRGEEKWTPTLIQLLADADESVSNAAAGGLARIANPTALEPLFKVLQNADADRRYKILENVREIAGGPGLVAMLASIKDKPVEAAWFQTKQIFDMLADINDPRMSAPLATWANATTRHKHWVGLAGIRLAEVGDLSAASLLADRLRFHPTKLYSMANFWEADEGGHLSRTDLSRVAAARMLADLAIIHPNSAAEIKSKAEDAVLDWVLDAPQPHANGMRFLAAVRSDKGLKQLREWAFPQDSLPNVGAQPPFPSVFETAQSALRYVGMRKDEPSFPKLLAQLQRKTDKQLDITQEGLMQAGMAMLGMSLRAIGYGAAQGLAHWRDPRAVAPLMTFIEDVTWHEEARQTACEALAFCADEKAMNEIAKKANEFGAKNDPRQQLIGSCYAQTLRISPVPANVPMLIDLLGPKLHPDLRISYARAIGAAALNPQNEDKLIAKLQDSNTRVAAALALVLGGSADSAARTVAMMASFDKNDMIALKDEYYRAFGFWTEPDFDRGNVYRWVANAEAISHLEIAGAVQAWSRSRLQAQFDNLRYDNGPHSVTRPVFRYRLIQDAKAGSDARKRSAIRTLVLMREKGALMMLSDEPGDLGRSARRALLEVTNPPRAAID